MILLLDIGNSRIKWAVMKQDGWSHGEPLLHKGLAFKGMADGAWKELEKPERVIISNVAGHAFEKALHMDKKNLEVGA